MKNFICSNKDAFSDQIVEIVSTKIKIVKNTEKVEAFKIFHGILPQGFFNKLRADYLNFLWMNIAPKRENSLWECLKIF